MIAATKIRLSEQKTKFYLSFLEREYLRGKASEIRLSEQKTKFYLSFLEHEYLRGEASEIL